MDIAIRSMETPLAAMAAQASQQSWVQELADPNSTFYRSMLEQMQKRAEEQKEQDREDAVIEAFGQVIDAMNRKADDPRKPGMAGSFAELAKSIGELDPDDPERVRLESLLKRLNELGIWFELPSVEPAEDEKTETLTQLLTQMRVKEMQTEI